GVESSCVMRMIVRRALESLGVTGTIEAADGVQALEIFKAFKASNEFDLVLTDWNMPGKTGIELVHEIRALDPKVPIVMITIEADKDRVLEAIEAGVSDYLIKPFTTDSLLNRLEQFTSR